MFLTGRRVDEADAKEPSKEEQKKEKEGSNGPKKTRFRLRPQSSAPGQARRSGAQPGERDFFAKAIVNRIWYRLFGQGLVMPLDQMHSANPPSHPELLDWLARDTALTDMTCAGSSAAWS